MTKFDNKFVVPQVPKTFQVLELRDQQQEQPVKKSNLSVAARSKVINRSGSNYLSGKEGYGPCSRSDCGCRSGETFTPLYTVCPATECPNATIPRIPTY